MFSEDLRYVHSDCISFSGVFAILSALGSVETGFGHSDCISFSGVFAILSALGSVKTGELAILIALVSVEFWPF